MHKHYNNLLFLIFFFILRINSINIHNFSEIINKSSENLNLRSLDIISNENNKKKNLVMGAIINYSWIKIKLYFISLVKANFENCDFVLFIGGISNETKRKIELCGVKTYQIPKEVLRLKTSIINFRWKLYKDYLSENKDKYNMVFAADVRDTIFQKDVFKYYDSKKPFLGAFLEDGNLKTKANRIWLLTFLNESEYRTIENNSVICAGTLIGTADKFYEFSQTLWYTIKFKRPVCDQGGANYLFYYKKFFNDCLIINDNHGFVLTIGMTNINNVLLDKDDNILNLDGKIAAAIHQYDRKKKIVEKLKIKFNDSFIFSQNYTFIKKQRNKNKSDKSIKKIIKYIFAFIFLSLIIIVYLIYSHFIKKSRMSLKKFKKVKLKTIGQQTKKKKFFAGINFYNKKNYYYRNIQEKESLI